MSDPYYGILKYLSAHDGSSRDVLAKATRCDPDELSHTLTEMCNKNLVNGNAQQINLTPDGRERLSQLQEQRFQHGFHIREEVRGWLSLLIATLALILSIFSVIWQMPLHG